MQPRKFLKILFLLPVLAALAFFLSRNNVQDDVMANPGSPVDETKIPHYFGPYPNWANSPLTLADAVVTITGDNGFGAEAVATVGANGAITGITIVNPGSGYTTANVAISGNGANAAASATVTTEGVVTAIYTNTVGAGYTQPMVTLSGGNGVAGMMVRTGNPIMVREYASNPEAEKLSNAIIVVANPLPEGILKDFRALNQAAMGEGQSASAGHSFTAYVLRPLGKDQYQIVYTSELLTFPALKNAEVSEVAFFAAPDVAVQQGDLLGFSGAGIPMDAGKGSDFACVVASAEAKECKADANAQGTYSFGANVVDTSRTSNAPFVNATATAYGGVDQINLTAAGSGYVMPTVDLDMPDTPDGVQAKAHAEYDLETGVITAIVVDQKGSGYMSAPMVVIRDGTPFDPINHTGDVATASATINVNQYIVDDYGSGYTSTPTVLVTDNTGIGSGATATALTDVGAISTITIDNAGSGYVSNGGIRKFVDSLPLVNEVGANNLGQYMPLGVPDTTTFPNADYYIIAVMQYREQMHSDLPPTLLREYVQLHYLAEGQTCADVGGVLLFTDLLDGTTTPTLMPDGSQACGYDYPHYLGPVIIAQRDRAVRITFFNLNPIGSDGDLFLPTDSTMMGSGMGPDYMVDPINQGTVMDEVRNPHCTEYPKNTDHCFIDSRATLHLHGGITPWISDGTPHQWTTPANSGSPWPDGVSVGNVPDMIGQAALDKGIPDCGSETDGCITFYYTNQQSARLMFYHDHAWGTTRLNVYAGNAAGYIIQDPVEQELVSNNIIPADQIPLVVQDRTFVPQAEQLAWQDPTWDSTRWGSYGNLWYHHVYMPAQNPSDPSGMSAFGRWMYGPWFWPPALNAIYQPIANPYYNMDPATNFTTPLETPCNLDDPTTWQYDTDPFCEPPLIPGTPNISAGMEQFNDTPIVNGTLYPYVTLEPKAYRFRILNAANDRFFNFQWYVADPTTASTGLNAEGNTVGGTEVAFNASELEAAQTDPNIFPTPDTAVSPVGPSWIQIGNEGGFLPTPTVIPNQPITWITDPTVFNVGNVDQHSLLLAPAERADVIVDFSQYAGQTLILYNDAPAAFPARVASYDYYTGGPDLAPVGVPTIIPGYGPNTRTVMQVRIEGTPAPKFNLTALMSAFKHHADGSGAYESAQHPVIVGQAPYNKAFGSDFVAAGYCNSPTNPSARCDGYARIADQGGMLFKFDTLLGDQLSIPIEPKAIHDEMNSSAFDEFGRMQANLGLEAVPATPNGQNILLYPYSTSPTEIYNAQNLPKNDISMTPITPISTADGTQIWKITHNGVDTHPIHWHLYDVQLLNRVTWDNIVQPPDANELGWKETIRISPLEDTYIAVRPIIPYLPFDLPNSIRELNPMEPDGVELFPGLIIDPQGNPVQVFNHLVNFGWEYVFHCHILSHEEMDMMRPVSVSIPPVTPDSLSFDVYTLTFSWTDRSLGETAFLVEKLVDGSWIKVQQINRDLSEPNTTGEVLTYQDATLLEGDQLRVTALNTVGDVATPGFPTETTHSDSVTLTVPVLPPAAPTNLTADVHQVANQIDSPSPLYQVDLNWQDNADNETGFTIERCSGVGCTNFAALASVGANETTYKDTAVNASTSYTYRVYAYNLWNSDYSNEVTIVTPALPGIYFSTNASAPVPGVPSPYDDADIYTWNGTSFSRVFQAIGHGLYNGASIDALTLVDANHFYVSLVATNTTVAGLGNVQDEDILYYNNGTWSVYFDGTSRGLTLDTQDIDASAIDNGILYFSIVGNASIPGVAGFGDNADIYFWDGTSFGKLFDATDAGLPASTDVDGFAIVNNTHFYLSFSLDTVVPGLGMVQDEDIVYYNNGTWIMFFDGTAQGLVTDAQDINAFDIGVIAP